jgi:hypothetical protein
MVMGGYQVCFKCSGFKHQAELIAEVQQAQDEDVAMDEQEEEDVIIAALAPPALMPILCKPIGLEAATAAVGSVLFIQMLVLIITMVVSSESPLHAPHPTPLPQQLQQEECLPVAEPPRGQEKFYQQVILARIRRR